RGIAPLLYQTLRDSADAIRDGERDFARLERDAVQRLNESGFRADYVAVRDAATLAAARAETQRMVVLGAAWLGKARLIDNVLLDLAGDDRTIRVSRSHA
ncbi:MAG TPA: pantoate--beta-alanine ligase, partial [Gammaproteobacteria bacterium]|nr:pantoate--beta-alanine ligase [Gammaproteobacteria bacterium]